MVSSIPWLPATAFTLLRPLGMFVIFPLLSSRNLSGTLVRNTLLLLVTLPIIPRNLELIPSITTNGTHLLCWSMQELLLGIFIGFAAALPFWALDMASFIIDTLRGASIGTLLNPLLGEQSSVFGVLFSQLFSVLFLAFGGFHILLKTLYFSYCWLPPGERLSFGSHLGSFLKAQWLLMFHLGLNFALPAMLIMVLIDVALGLLNRSAQQLNVFFLAMPIKSIFTLLLLIVSLTTALQRYQTHLLTFMPQMKLLFQRMVP